MYKLGIDLGGTNIVAGVVDEKYRIVATAKRKTNLPRPAEEIVDDLVAVAYEAIENAGLTEADIIPQYQSFGDSADALKDRKIDAAFIVAGAPTPAIQELCTSATAYLVPIDGDIAAKLMAASPYYTTYKVPAGTYNGQTSDVTTVTVKATLIVSTSASEDAVYNVTKAIFDNIDTITAAHAKGAELSLQNATDGMTAPFHAGAAKYFKEKGIDVETK